MACWYVYLVRCSDDTLYCGIATDVDRRLRQHNGLLRGGARYTRSRRPVTLVASCPCPSHSAALHCEACLKKQPRERKVRYLSGLRLQHPCSI